MRPEKIPGERDSKPLFFRSKRNERKSQNQKETSREERFLRPKNAPDGNAVIPLPDISEEVYKKEPFEFLLSPEI